MRRHVWLMGWCVVVCAAGARAQVVGEVADPVGGVAGRALTSGPLALTADDGTLVVGDEDTGELVLIDVAAWAERARVWVGARPGAVLALPSGEVAVACRGEAWVTLVDPELERVTRRIATDLDPRALASDGERIYVAAFADATVAAYDLSTGAGVWSRPVAAGPVALALDVRRSRLFVGHLAAGEIEALDPLDGTPGADDATARPFGGGTLTLAPLPRGDVLAPSFGHFPHLHWSKGADGDSGAYGGTPEAPLAAQLELVGVSGRRDAVHARRTAGPSAPRRVLVPTAERSPLDLPATLTPPAGEVRSYIARAAEAEASAPASMTAAAHHPSGRVFIVDTALGKLWVVERLGQHEAGHARRGDVWAFELGVAPTGLAFDRTGERVFVAFGHARGVAVARVADATRVEGRRTVRQLDPRVWRSLTYGGPIAPEVAVARRLFHTVDARVSSRDLACASCHPDGLSDGRTWTQSFGPRQTPALAGRLEGTGPFGWTGSAADLEEHLAQTIRHRLLGSGLGDADLAALGRFVEALPAPIAPSAERDLVARGRALFERPDVGCALCHDPESRFTDRGRYDVGTTSQDERFRAGAARFSRTRAAADAPLPVPIAYDVPSLVGLAHTAPYFHDGRAATLLDVVTTQNPHDRMGTTSHLSPPDLDALVAFLGTL